MAHEALPLQLGQDGERLLERAFGGSVHVEHAAQVDHVEHVQAEVAQIVVHRLGQLARARTPAARSRPRRAGPRSW